MPHHGGWGGAWGSTRVGQEVEGEGELLQKPLVVSVGKNR